MTSNSDLILTKGKKGPGDCKIHWVCKDCGGLHSPKYLDVIEWFCTAYANEDRIYPPSKGFKGGAMLVEALANALENGFDRERLRKKYKLP